ncbi:formate dehydrogenase accessory sulfurtransferase FdhD [Bartonella apis]|uniref:Sulfur carrier protein FdhD n=1 Tax=Bartonella apis TaxID=1686310 RepID=A0A1R0F914_9HYPH|nr:formate dehydrogenase accessory sulfurtransferase FdhD [Bartonella apis]MCT6825001.1 formate dehydrogenase accessory sulfurtransferase FdhD [Bartonella apis]MCT6860729.1 formate dehydrogenase accessory sulfurtransferase FdhD [Bartonella apis]MCT6886880.1 formate dehydrogenase accessory sulfurtransferase FdhD [Bartonella apis]OLY43455.1 FdhD protein [Bartonella apis]OLY46191.1 FdhD protein [Bartonella apis]
MTILKKACPVEKKAESTFSDTVLVDADVVSKGDRKRQQIRKTVAEEVPIALSYDGTTQAVLMASPDDLIDFAYGFSLTEEFISDPDEIENIDIVPLSRGIDVQIALRVDRREAFRKRRRSMAGPVGCGLCGIESIDAAMRDISEVKRTDVHFDQDEIFAAAREICGKQILNNATRAVHAAAFYEKNKGIIAIREDVGRHNALDKLCGYLFYNRKDVSSGFIVVTSRLSVEMVQKAAVSGVSTLVAVSAATAEAIRIGQKCNMTLIGRTREKDFEIYCGKEWII